jgi:hypothetical protein
VEGVDLPLWGMEVDVERARADIRVCLDATFLLYGADHQAALPRTQTLVIILSQSLLQSLLKVPDRHCSAWLCRQWRQQTTTGETQRRSSSCRPSGWAPLLTSCRT